MLCLIGEISNQLIYFVGIKTFTIQMPFSIIWIKLWTIMNSIISTKETIPQELEEIVGKDCHNPWWINIIHINMEEVVGTILPTHHLTLTLMASNNQ